MLIYVAAPYYDVDKEVIQRRMETVYSFIGTRFKEGEHPITPLFMHEVVLRHDLPGDYLFWEHYCLNILKRCNKMVVLKMDGWDRSRGVAGEIAFCESNNIPYELVDIEE